MIEKNVISNILFGLLTSTTLVTGIGGAAKVAQTVDKYKPELPQVKSVEEIGYTGSTIKEDLGQMVQEPEVVQNDIQNEIQEPLPSNLPVNGTNTPETLKEKENKQSEITKVIVVTETKEVPVSSAEPDPRSKNSLDTNEDSQNSWDDEDDDDKNYDDDEKDEDDKWEEEKKEMEDDWEEAKEEYENQKESHDEEDHDD